MTTIIRSYKAELTETDEDYLEKENGVGRERRKSYGYTIKRTADLCL